MHIGTSDGIYNTMAERCFSGMHVLIPFFHMYLHLYIVCKRQHSIYVFYLCKKKGRQLLDRILDRIPEPPLAICEKANIIP